MNPTAPSGYRLYRGVPADLPLLLTGATNACLRFTGLDEAATTATGLVEEPGAGLRSYWYLVTGLNAFGEGPAGDASAGARRVATSGACP